MASRISAPRAAVALALSGLSLAACGSSNDESSTATPILVQAPSPVGDGVSVVQPDGTLGRQLSPAEMSAKHGDWSPDAETIVFVDDADGSLWTMRADGSEPTQLLACDDDCFYLDFPAYSPNGRSLVYTRYEEPAGDGPPSASSIMVLDLAAGTSTEVAHAEQPELVDVARWSTDGSQLVVGIDVFDEEFNEIGSTIGVLPAAGGDIRRLLDTDSFAYAPDWSVDDLIVFGTETMQYRADPQTDEGTWNLWTIRPDGTDATTVTDVEQGTQLIQPSWAPDGDSILATMQTGGQGSTRRIVRVDLDSGTVTPVSTELGTHPRARPGD